MLAAIVRMGAQGKLDGLSVPLGSMDRAGLTGEVAREAGDPETEGLVEEVLQTVTHYVAKHPFEG